MLLSGLRLKSAKHILKSFLSFFSKRFRIFILSSVYFLEKNLSKKFRITVRCESKALQMDRPYVKVGELNSGQSPVSQKSRNFSGLFRVPQFPLYLGNAEAVSHQTSRFSWFSYIKNTLKDQLFKTSGLQFDNWLFGPEKFSGLFDLPKGCK